MTSFTTSIVAIIPLAYKNAIEALGAILGYSGQEYSVELSGTSDNILSHYGLVTVMRPLEAVAWQAMKLDTSLLPEVEGFTATEIENAANAVILDFQANLAKKGAEHFKSVLTSNNLKILSNNG